MKIVLILILLLFGACSEKPEKVEYVNYIEGKREFKVSFFINPKLGDKDSWNLGDLKSAPTEIYALHQINKKEVVFKTCGLVGMKIYVIFHKKVDKTILVERKVVYNPRAEDLNKGTYDYKEFTIGEKSSKDNFSVIHTDTSYYYELNEYNQFELKYTRVIDEHDITNKKKYKLKDSKNKSLTDLLNINKTINLFKIIDSTQKSWIEKYPNYSNLEKKLNIDIDYKIPYFIPGD